MLGGPPAATVQLGPPGLPPMLGSLIDVSLVCGTSLGHSLMKYEDATVVLLPWVPKSSTRTSSFTKSTVVSSA